MNVNMLYDAIGEISTEYIEDAEYEPPLRLPIAFRSVVAVLVAVIMLAVPVSAEMVNGYVSNLFAPLYGVAQTELVDQIGVPIGATITLGDYCLTADAVIGDRYNIAIVYSLTRNDGGQLDEGINFANYSNSLQKGNGVGMYNFCMSDDKTTCYIVDVWTAAGSLFLDRMAEVTFTDIMIFDSITQENKLLQAGEWSLKFTVRYEDSSVTIPTTDTVIKDARGKEYIIHQMIVSPVGIHLDITAPNPHINGIDNTFQFADMSLTIVLRDGTVQNIENISFETHGDMNAKTLEANIGALFNEPIPLERIVGILLCDTLLLVEA